MEESRKFLSLKDNSTPQRLRDACLDLAALHNNYLFLEEARTRQDKQQYKGDGNRKLGLGLTCYNCGMKGHTSHYCTKPKTEVSGNGTCFHCGSADHLKRDCPQLKQENQKPNPALKSGTGKGSAKEMKSKNPPVNNVVSKAIGLTRTLTLTWRKMCNKTLHWGK